jgi:hypothetical protein
MSATACALWVISGLLSARRPQGAKLYGRGRDLDELEAAVAFDKIAARWTILGDASAVYKSNARKAILTALGDEAKTFGVLLHATGMGRNNRDTEKWSTC